MLATYAKMLIKNFNMLRLSLTKKGHKIISSLLGVFLRFCFYKAENNCCKSSILLKILCQDST